MIVNLAEIDSQKPLLREISWERETLPTPSGSTSVHDLVAKLSFRVAPNGFLVHYDIKARVQQDCIRCGQDVSSQIETEDWLGLRQKHPRENHLTLADSEMNVRFIHESLFDVKTMIKEIVELELPSFPRHEETNSQCTIPNWENEETQEPSPFSILEKFLGQ